MNCYTLTTHLGTLVGTIRNHGDHQRFPILLAQAIVMPQTTHTHFKYSPILIKPEELYSWHR